MKWYYAEGGKQLGPIDETALDDLVRQGVVRDETLVWREGMAAWQRHGVVRGSSSGSKGTATAAPPMPAPVEPGLSDSRYCAECGRPFPASQLTSFGDVAVCGQCQPAYSQRMRNGAAVKRHFGGFWIRFVALVIDGIILGAVGLIVRIPLGLAIGGAGLTLGRNPDPSEILGMLPAVMGMIGLFWFIHMALSLAYEVYFLTTRGATPGKMVLGLKVIREDGSNLSAGVAAGRFFGKYLSGLTLCIGFLLAAFDREKRALHDHICQTRVIYAR
jgi:uncharacterized RDD family membrane protein YckC